MNVSVKKRTFGGSKMKHFREKHLLMFLFMITISSISISSSSGGGSSSSCCCSSSSIKLVLVCISLIITTTIMTIIVGKYNGDNPLHARMSWGHNGDNII